MFVLASAVAHAGLLVAFAALGGGAAGRGGGAAQQAPAASPMAAVEVLEDERTPDVTPDVALDEIAGRAGAAAPPPAIEPQIELSPHREETAPAPPRASASARPERRPPRPGPTSSGSAVPSSTAAAAAATSASSGPEGAGPGLTPDEGAGHARKAPDLAARLNKDLPQYASPVEGWASLEDGEAGRVTFTIALDRSGKIVQDSFVIQEAEPAPPPALVESVRRTILALRMTLALPDQPGRAGRLTASIRATVKHGEPRPDIQKFRIGSEYAKKRGRAEFELESGLLVTFALEVERVEVDGATPPD